MKPHTISETLSPHQTLLLAIYWLFSGHLPVIFLINDHFGAGGYGMKDGEAGFMGQANAAV